MPDKTNTIALAAGLGVVAGMRSMAAPALLARHVPKRLGQGAVTKVLARPAATAVLGVLAVLEMIADKTPFVPNRTEPPALAGRAVMGAVCGVAVAELWKGPRIAAGLAGSVAAIASTFAFFHLRRLATKSLGLPDTAVALAEDALVLAVGSRLSGEAGVE